MECKRKWEHQGPVQMEGKLRQMSEEASEKSGNILRIFLYWELEIPSMSYDVVQSLLHR